MILGQLSRRNLFLFKSYLALYCAIQIVLFCIVSVSKIITTSRELALSDRKQINYKKRLITKNKSNFNRFIDFLIRYKLLVIPDNLLEYCFNCPFGNPFLNIKSIFLLRCHRGFRFLVLEPFIRPIVKFFYRFNNLRIFSLLQVDRLKSIQTPVIKVFLHASLVVPLVYFLEIINMPLRYLLGFGLLLVYFLINLIKSLNTIENWLISELIGSNGSLNWLHTKNILADQPLGLGFIEIDNDSACRLFYWVNRIFSIPIEIFTFPVYLSNCIVSIIIGALENITLLLIKVVVNKQFSTMLKPSFIHQFIYLDKELIINKPEYFIERFAELQLLKNFLQQKRKIVIDSNRLSDSDKSNKKLIFFNPSLGLLDHYKNLLDLVENDDLLKNTKIVENFKKYDTLRLPFVAKNIELFMGIIKSQIDPQLLSTIRKNLLNNLPTNFNFFPDNNTKIKDIVGQNIHMDDLFKEITESFKDDNSDIENMLGLAMPLKDIKLLENIYWHSNRSTSSTTRSLNLKSIKDIIKRVADSLISPIRIGDWRQYNDLLKNNILSEISRIDLKDPIETLILIRLAENPQDFNTLAKTIERELKNNSITDIIKNVISSRDIGDFYSNFLQELALNSRVLTLIDRLNRELVLAMQEEIRDINSILTIPQTYFEIIFYELSPIYQRIDKKILSDTFNYLLFDLDNDTSYNDYWQKMKEIFFLLDQKAEKIFNDKSQDSKIPNKLEFRIFTKLIKAIYDYHGVFSDRHPERTIEPWTDLTQIYNLLDLKTLVTNDFRGSAILTKQPGNTNNCSLTSRYLYRPILLSRIGLPASTKQKLSELEPIDIKVLFVHNFNDNGNFISNFCQDPDSNSIDLSTINLANSTIDLFDQRPEKEIRKQISTKIQNILENFKQTIVSLTISSKDQANLFERLKKSLRSTIEKIENIFEISTTAEANRLKYRLYTNYFKGESYQAYLYPSLKNTLLDLLFFSFWVKFSELYNIFTFDLVNNQTFLIGTLINPFNIVKIFRTFYNVIGISMVGFIVGFLFKGAIGGFQIFGQFNSQNVLFHILFVSFLFANNNNYDVFLFALYFSYIITIAIQNQFKLYYLNTLLKTSNISDPVVIVFKTIAIFFNFKPICYKFFQENYLLLVDRFYSIFKSKKLHDYPEQISIFFKELLVIRGYPFSKKFFERLLSLVHLTIREPVKESKTDGFLTINKAKGPSLPIPLFGLIFNGVNDVSCSIKQDPFIKKLIEALEARDNGQRLNKKELDDFNFEQFVSRILGLFVDMLLGGIRTQSLDSETFDQQIFKKNSLVYFLYILLVSSIKILDLRQMFSNIENMLPIY